MNMAYLAGIICGLLVGVISVAIILKATKTDGAIRCKFDERQKIVRATGFKYAFFTLLIYDLAYGIFNSATDKRWAEDLPGLFIGCCISVVVYAAYAIWNEGYFSLNEKPGRLLVVFAVVGGLNLMLGIRSLIHGNMVKDGILTFECMNFVCGLTFIAIFALLFMKWQVSKGEAD